MMGKSRMPNEPRMMHEPRMTGRPLVVFSLFLYVELVCFHGTILFPSHTGLALDHAMIIVVVALAGKTVTYFRFFVASLLRTSRVILLGKAGLVLSLVGACLFLVPEMGGGIVPRPDPLFGLYLISGLLIGVGNSLISLYWGSLCTTLSLRKNYSFVLAGQALALALYCVGFMIPDEMLMAFLVLILAISIPLFFFAPDIEQPVFSSEGFRVTFSDLWRPVFGTCVLCLLAGVIPWLSGQYDGSATTMALLSVGSSAVMLLLLALPVVIIRERMKLESAFRLILPIVATGFFLLPIIWNGFGGIVNAFVGAGVYAANIVLWCLIADSSRNNRLDAVTMFGLSLGLTTLFTALGRALGYFGGKALHGEDFIITAVSLIALYLLSMVALFAFRRRKAEDSSDSPAASSDPDATSSLYEIQRKCDEYSKAYGLTKRESEILFYLARGTPAAEISSQLGISVNTAKSHIRHTYRKLGVHSKQDVIVMFRSAATDRDPPAPPAR